MAKLFSRTNFILTNRTIKFNAKVIQFQHDVIKININLFDFQIFKLLSDFM